MWTDINRKKDSAYLILIFGRSLPILVLAQPTVVSRHRGGFV